MAHADGKTSSFCSRHVFRILLLSAIVVLTLTTIWRESPEAIVSNLSTFAASFSGNVSSMYNNFPGLLAQDDLMISVEANPTGLDLHLSPCGVTWGEYYAQLPQAVAHEQKDHAFQWTVSGGVEYKASAADVLATWKALGLSPVLVVALDENTTRAVCDAGFHAVHWNAPIASYSRVADAKFYVAAAIAEQGYRGFFIEMDVFCRKNPVPYFLPIDYDLVNVGHGDVGYFTNIGVFMAAPMMGPFFQGLKKVLAFSKDHRQHTNQANWTVDFFDQGIYQHCLPTAQQNEDDDNSLFQFSYFLFDDTERKNDLLKNCQEFVNFSHTWVPHHVMSNHDPPTIFDSTLCIHPLAGRPFTPFAFKLGTAKFFGWDPKPIGPDEKLLKLYPGDLEFNNCWGRVFHHGTRMDDHTAHNKVAFAIASMVEICLATNRTLVLPQYIRDKESWGIPTHAVVDVRHLGVPYRFLTREASRELVDVQVFKAAYNFSETFRRATLPNLQNTKVLAINMMCNLRDDPSNVVKERQKQMRWCFEKDLEWSRAVGAWMDFCDMG